MKLQTFEAKLDCGIVFFLIFKLLMFLDALNLPCRPELWICEGQNHFKSAASGTEVCFLTYGVYDSSACYGGLSLWMFEIVLGHIGS